MFTVTVTAKFITHAKIKYTELYLIDPLSLGQMCVKKFTSFYQVLKTMLPKEIGFFYSASRCIRWGA